MKPILALVIAGMLWAVPVIVFAAHPLSTDDPFPVGPLHIAMDQTYDTFDSQHEAVTSFTTGISARMDFGVSVGQEGENRSIDPEIAVKWLAFGEDDDAPAGAITLGYVTKPHAADKEAGNRPDFGVNLVYQHPVKIGMMYVNLGHTWAGDAGSVNCINCSIALKSDLCRTFSLVGEAVGVLNTRALDGEPQSVKEYLVGGIYTGQTGLTYSAGAAYNPDSPGTAWRITSGLAMEF